MGLTRPRPLCVPPLRHVPPLRVGPGLGLLVLGLLCPPAAAQEGPAAPAEPPAAAPEGPAAPEDPAAAAQEGPAAPAEPPAVDPADPTALTGLRVIQVGVAAGAGALPGADLESLLRVKQDQPLNPQDVRRDLALLYRVADFAQVEADVQVVMVDGADGPEPAVVLTYVAYPPPHLRRIHVAGSPPLSRRALLAATDLDRGDAWFEGDRQARERDLVAALRARGYPEARAELLPGEPDEHGDLDLTVVIEEGPRQRVGELRLRGNPALGPSKAAAVLREAGLGRGDPLTPAALARAREALVGAARAAGWYEARVTLDLGAEQDGRVPLVVLVDPGRQFVWTRVGHDLPDTDHVEATLGLDRGVRLTRSWAEDAARELAEADLAEGYLRAHYELAVEERPGVVAVRLAGARGPRHRLGTLRFTGNEAEADEVWSRRYLDGAFREAAEDTLRRRRVSPQGIDQALAAMTEFYRAKGYLSARLEVAGTEARRDAGRVVPLDVTVRVAPGPRTMLEGVVVQGADPTVASDGMFAALVGAPIDPSRLEALARKLVEAHTALGFLDADAAVSITVAEDGTAASATVTVRPGERVFLRTVLIKGYRRTRRVTIEREVDLVPGEPIAPERVEEVRRRLYDLGVFSRVDLTAAGDEDRVKDVVISVEEKKNLHFEVGGGVATDEGMKLFLRGGHRNLFGRAQRLTFSGQAGIGWAGDSWVPSVQAAEWRVGLRYEAPHVPTRGERTAVDVVLRERDQERAYLLERSGIGASLLLNVGPRNRAQVGYRFEERRLVDVDPGMLVEGDPWLDALGLADDPLTDPSPRLPSRYRPEGSFTFSFVFDRRNDPFNPTRGGVASVGLEYADPIVNPVSFVRVEGSWTEWVPLGRLQGLLRLRGGSAAVSTAGATLPLEDRFQLGGGASFRGFSLDSLGPANEVSPADIQWPDAIGPIVDWAGRDSPSRWVPTGGDTMGVATLELWVPFDAIGFASLSGTNLALFSDVGNTWFLSTPVVADSAGTALDPVVRASFGVGLRRSTAVGPVQVDLGVNPWHVAAREETLLKVHLSLGAL